MAQAIREVVANAILFEMADPRVRSVTVLKVDVAGDLRNATVHVSIMGSDSEQKLALRGLRHAAGFIQSRVADRLQMRFTPILSFKIDEGVKKSIEVSRAIDEALAADRGVVANASLQDADENENENEDEDGDIESDD